MAPKTSITSKKMLTSPDSTCAPLVMERHFWIEALVVKDYFWAQVENNRTEAVIPFELTSSSSAEAIPRGHQTPFMDHMKGEGI